MSFNTLRPRQNGRHFADDIFKCIFLNANIWIPIKISMKFVPKGPINNISALVRIMAWRRLGDKLLSEPMMVSLLTHICVTRPQWVNLYMKSNFGDMAIVGSSYIYTEVSHTCKTFSNWLGAQGTVLIYRCRLTSKWIPVLKKRRSRDRLRFNTGIYRLSMGCHNVFRDPGSVLIMGQVTQFWQSILNLYYSTGSWKLLHTPYWHSVSEGGSVSSSWKWPVIMGPAHNPLLLQLPILLHSMTLADYISDKNWIQQVLVGLSSSFPINYTCYHYTAVGKYCTLCVQMLDGANWHEAPWKLGLFTFWLWSGHCCQLAFISKGMIQIYILGARLMSFWKK